MCWIIYTNSSFKDFAVKHDGADYFAAKSNNDAIYDIPIGEGEYPEDNDPKVVLNLMSDGFKKFGIAEIERLAIKKQIKELIEAYKVTLLLSKVFPESKDFKTALLQEKNVIKTLRLKLI